MFKIALCEIRKKRKKDSNSEDSNLKSFMSLKDLYLCHPNKFVMLVLLAGFDGKAFESLGPDVMFLGINFKIELHQEELQYWAEFFSLFLNEFPDIVIKVCNFFTLIFFYLLNQLL